MSLETRAGFSFICCETGKISTHFKFLFSASLKRNLAFGRDEVPDEEIEDAVRLTRLDRDVAIFPEGLNTIVGERGITLSGGQKQRATLARAILLDAPFLVLDDCLSSVDAQTLPVFLPSLFDPRNPFLATMSAASICISLPVLIAGFAAQDKLVQGLSLGAVK